MESIMEITIYKITSPSGKNYVGRTMGFSHRMVEHKSLAFNETTDKYNYPLYRAIRKYGWDNMKSIELAKCSKDDMCEVELAYIVKYDGFNGYNTQRNTEHGGDVWEGRYDTPEYKQFVEKMKDITTGYQNGMYGKKHNAETIVELKKKAKGRFSLHWFQDKYGKTEGQVKYDDRCLMLKNRVMKKDKYGRFTS
jgi:group I intron endonuclease